MSTQPAVNYFEDFAVGMKFQSHAVEVRIDQIVRFAGEFDPQPFHLDAQAAHASFFGTLVASGWHTAALTMRLLVESDLSIAGGLIGAGAEIKWPAAMRPGDRVHVEVEVTATRILRTRTDMGLITTRTLTVNQAGTIVQELVANLFVPRRGTAVQTSSHGTTVTADTTGTAGAAGTEGTAGTADSGGTKDAGAAERVLG